jgi:hypothetical protein
VLSWEAEIWEAQMPSNDEVMFVATYRSGHEEWLWGNSDVVLRHGDQVAWRIAQERQDGGWLPEGVIVNVERRVRH